MDFWQESTVRLFLSVWLLWPWNLSCCQLLERAKGTKFFLYKSLLKLTRLGGWTSFPELLLSKDQEKNKILVEPGKILYLFWKNIWKKLIRRYMGHWSYSATPISLLPLSDSSPLFCVPSVIFSYLFAHDNSNSYLSWILRKPTTSNNLSLTELTKPFFRARYIIYRFDCSSSLHWSYPRLSIKRDVMS